MKVNALRRVSEFVMKHPPMLWMDLWARQLDHVVHEEQRKNRGCETVGCLAGWSIIMKNMESGMTMADATRAVEDLSSSEAQRAGARNFGLTLEKAKKLFYLENWPAKFRDAYFDAGMEPKPLDGYIKRAEITAERIEHFIKTEGAE